MSTTAIRHEVEQLSLQQMQMEFRSYDLLNEGKVAEAAAAMDAAREIGARRDRLQAELTEIEEEDGL